jgi:hypothetical protein
VTYTVTSRQRDKGTEDLMHTESLKRTYSERQREAETQIFTDTERVRHTQ